MDDSILEKGVLHVLYSDWLALISSGFKVFSGTFVCYQGFMRSNDVTI